MTPTHSIARTIEHPKGWQAEYFLSGEREPHTLADACGRPIVYRTHTDALLAAYQALVAAMERVDAAYIAPTRPTVRRPWQGQIIRPRTKAGRKAMFYSIFKERAEA